MKNETGRTLVELISVLAIMAVLAVTGIVAYHYAMVKYQANELVHKANLAYVDVISRESLDEITDLKITDLNGNPLKGFIYNDAGFIIAESVDKDICNRILNDKTNFSILTSKGSDLTLCEGETGMIFSFSNAKDVGFECRDKSDCEDGQIWDDVKTDSCQYCYDIDIDTPVYSEESCIGCNAGDTWYDADKTCITCPAFSSDIKNENQMGDKPCYCDIDFTYMSESDSCQPSTCETKMIAYGFDAEKYSVSDLNISYTGEMLVDKNLDLSGCNLNIDGALSVASGGNLTVNVINTTGGNSIFYNFEEVNHLVGIWNNGIIKASAIHIEIPFLNAMESSGRTLGILNNNIIEATDFDIKTDYVSGDIKAQSLGIINRKELKADTIKIRVGSSISKTYAQSVGLESASELTVDTLIDIKTGNAHSDNVAFLRALMNHVNLKANIVYLEIGNTDAKIAGTQGFINKGKTEIVYLSVKTGSSKGSNRTISNGIENQKTLIVSEEIVTKIGSAECSASCDIIQNCNIFNSSKIKTSKYCGIINNSGTITNMDENGNPEYTETCN